MKKIVILFLLSFAILSAKEQDAPYLTSECDTLALVEGVVNAYNGKLVQIDRDIEIQGQDPLEMTRYYDGGHHFDSEFGYGIGCSYPALLRFFWNEDKAYASLELRMGCEVLLGLKKDKGKGKNVFTGEVAKEYFKSGYTNCCEALLRGEPSIYAMRLELSPEKAVLDLGNGTKRHYKHYIDRFYEGSYYLLQLEELGNRNRRHFSYKYTDGVFRLKRIWTTNYDDTLTLNWLEFDDHDHHMTVKGSNGQEVHYVKRVEKGTAEGGNLLAGYKGKFSKEILREAWSNHCPATQYEAIKRTRYLNTIFSLTKVKKSGGRFLEVEYDSSESVNKLFSSGIDYPLYTFDYHTGYTLATDARGAKKRFEFSKRRLTKLVENHRQQTFEWDDKGQLTAHTIQTPAGASLSKQTYRYDERGNILEIKLQGCLTQKDSQDTVVTRYTYAKDNNVILTENHNNEVEYAYRYHPGTTLLASKLTHVSQKILEREFYAYGKNGILISKVVDDGCKPDKDNLEQVSYRLITEIVPHINPNLPGMTLPHFIREWYLDPKTGQKHLLKKIERLYTQGDLLAEEKVFDATDTYLYSQIYKYNQRRELVSETNALGETTIYAYDDAGNKTYEEKTNTGKKTHFTYDLANRLIQEKEDHPDRQFTKYYTYDALGNRLSSIDIYGQKTVYQYDLAGREISCTDPLGHTERKEYDPFGNVVKTIDKAGYATETGYNLFNDPFEIRYPDGSSKKFAYNCRGHLIQEWNRDGTSLVYHVDYQGCVKEALTYGSDGVLLKTLTYEYKGSHLIKETDALGNVTSYVYDGAGRKTAKIQGERQTLYEYDNLGRLAKTSLGNRLEISTFDFLNRILEERVEDPSGNIYRKIEYAYDPAGNLTTKREFSNPDKYAEMHTLYNSQQMPILEIDPLGHQIEISYRQTDHLEKETLDPVGRRTLEIYDPRLRVKEINILSPAGTLLADTTFTYGSRGNQTGREDQVLVEGVLLSTHKITAAYDAMNQKVKETEQGTKTTEWAYEKGKLHTLKMADGVMLTHRYDPLGRLSEQLSSDQTIHHVFSYDLNDNLLQAEDPIHQTTTIRSYDSFNRLVYEKQATGFEYTYVYDDLNRITKMTFCDGEVNYAYSPLHLLSASRSKEDQLLYTYTQQLDWRGKIQQATLPNQTSIVYQWDDKGRCTCIDTPAYKQTLTYDALGNLIETEVQDGLGSYKALFDYDGLHQLICELGHFENAYRYDSLQNRRNKNENSHTVDALNHLQHDGTHEYHHDLTGRRTHKGDARYTYDALGRLTAFQGERTITFHYDPLGRRLSASSPDSTIQYLYQLDTEIGAYEQGKLTEFRLTHKKATLEIELNGSPYTPIRNSRGDICQLQDAHQAPTTTYRYDAFGANIQEGTLSSPWLFSGQRYDPLTGLYHFDKREYDPHAGRWLTPDPLAFAEGPNLFTYVKNNPLIYIDPYGLWWAETKDFIFGSTRGFVDDISWHTSHQMLGTYRPTSTAGTCGYHLGTWASMAVGLCIGSTEARAASAAYSSIKKLPSVLSSSTKSLRETFNFTKSTSNNTPVKQVFDQVKASEKFVSNEGIALLSRGAENVNSASSLKTKLSQLERFQETSPRTRILPDGRIRYYDVENLARTKGLTHSACNVLEWNPKTYQSRWWYECHDQFGNVNRVHPKYINGQNISSPHYPPTSRELIP